MILLGNVFKYHKFWKKTWSECCDCNGDLNSPLRLYIFEALVIKLNDLDFVFTLYISYFIFSLPQNDTCPNINHYYCSCCCREKRPGVTQLSSLAFPVIHCWGEFQYHRVYYSLGSNRFFPISFLFSLGWKKWIETSILFYLSERSEKWKCMEEVWTCENWKFTFLLFYLQCLKSVLR